MDLASFAAMARYNSWMNAKLYEVASTLSPEARRLDRGLLFRSVHGLCNHLLVADHIWMGRFHDVELEPGHIGPHGVRSLDQILFEDFDALRTARTEMDAEIQRWVETLTPDDLQRPLLRSKGPALPMWCSLLHFFNHQTHHRGQITALLAQAGADYGVTDLVAMLRAEAS